MRSHPPDHDPELRRAFALSKGEQLALLTALAGGDPATPVMTFEPVGLDLRRTAHALSCVGRPFPDHILDSDTSELVLTVEHSLFDRPFDQYRYAPRRQDLIEQLETLAAQIAPRRGVLRMPCIPKRRWSMRTLRRVIDVMVRHLPDAPDDLSHIRVNTSTSMVQSRGCVYLTVTPSAELWQPVYEGRPPACYVVVLHLKSDVYPTFWWNNTFSLADLDKSIELYEAQHPKASPNAAKPTAHRSALEPEDRDDDLTDIEKAARSALHGDRGLTGLNSGEQQHASGRSSALADIQDKLTAISAQLGKTADVMKHVGGLLNERYRGGEQTPATIVPGGRTELHSGNGERTTDVNPAPETTTEIRPWDSPLLYDIRARRSNMEVEAESFRIADQHAIAHLEAGRNWMMCDDDNQHWEAFAAIAIEDQGHNIEAATKDLDRLDAIIRQSAGLESGFPSDAACNRWSPEIDAAYHFGLALGFRLGRKDATE
jgi:hypothetical protein